MTPEEAFKRLDEELSFRDVGECFTAFKEGISYQENQQLLCLVQIREALGDKEGRMMQDKVVERVKGMVNPWSPISTAPKDGTKLLLWSEYHEAIVGWWGASDVWDDKGTWIFGECLGDNYNTYLQVDSPTHWTTLPTEPKKDGA